MLPHDGNAMSTSAITPLSCFIPDLSYCWYASLLLRSSVQMMKKQLRKTATLHFVLLYSQSWTNTIHTLRLWLFSLPKVGSIYQTSILKSTDISPCVQFKIQQLSCEKEIKFVARLNHLSAFILINKGVKHATIYIFKLIKKLCPSMEKVHLDLHLRLTICMDLVSVILLR